MQVINPIMSGEQFTVEKITSSKTWTVPSGVYHFWVMVWGAGGMYHSTYTGGAGGGYLRCANVFTKPGVKYTATVAPKNTTVGASGQASSFSGPGLVTLTANGGGGVSSNNGADGGAGGGGGYADGQSSGSNGGRGHYGGGGGGGISNIYGSYTGQGGSGGLWGGGGGAAGYIKKKDGSGSYRTGSGGAAGQSSSYVTLFDFVVTNQVVSYGGATGKTGNTPTHIIGVTDDKMLIFMFKKQFSALLNLLEMKGPGNYMGKPGSYMNTQYEYSGGTGGAGIVGNGGNVFRTTSTTENAIWGGGGAGGGGFFAKGGSCYELSGGGGGGFFNDGANSYKNIYGGGGGGALSMYYAFGATKSKPNFDYGGTGLIYIGYIK